MPVFRAHKLYNLLILLYRIFKYRFFTQSRALFDRALCDAFCTHVCVSALFYGVHDLITSHKGLAEYERRTTVSCSKPLEVSMSPDN
jgi:hypothetical protein